MSASGSRNSRSLMQLFEPETKQEPAGSAANAAAEPPVVEPVPFDPEVGNRRRADTPGVIHLPPAHLDYDVARIRLRRKSDDELGSDVVDVDVQLPPETRNATLPLEERNMIDSEFEDFSQPSTHTQHPPAQKRRSEGTTQTGSNSGSGHDTFNSFRELVQERRTMDSTGRDRYTIELARKSSWELQPPPAGAGTKGYSVLGFIKAHGQSTVFLIALGAILGLLETGIDSAIAGFGEAIRIILELTSNDGYIVQLVAFVAFVLGLTATAATLTKFVDPKAAGSGIPEMKYILSSDVHKEPRRLLHFSTLFVKVFGLIMMVGSGLPIGREGPFVHMAGIVTNLLLRIPFFRESNLSGGVKRQLFAAACAVGVSSTFAAPVGGVLFSIEINNTYYLVSNYWKSFVAAIVAATAAQMFARTKEPADKALGPFLDAPVTRADTSLLEYFVALILGIVLGVAGVWMVKWQMIWKRAFLAINRQVPILAAAGVSIVAAVVFFVTGPFNRQGFFALLDQLLGVDPLPSQWDFVSKYYSLAMFLLTRAVLVGFTTALAVPAGDFVPQFMIGAAFGRLIGEGLNDAFPEYGFSPAGYAILCAAGLTASSTQTLSTAVLAMELTGTLGLHIPLLIVALTASGVSKMIGRSIYDEMIRLKKYKSLPLLGADIHLRQTAKQVMESDVKYLPTRTTIGKIVDLLSEVKFQAIPIVDDEKSLQFLGCVSRKHLVDFVYRRFYERHGEDILKQALPDEYAAVDSARYRRMGLRRRIPWMRRDDEEEDDEVASGASGHSHRTHFLQSAVQVLMNEEVDLSQTDEVPIDVSPFRVSAMMPMEQVYVLFAMLRCSRVFVTDYGKLVGVISQDILIDKLDALSKAPPQRVQSAEFVPAHINAGTIAHSASNASLAREEAGPDVEARRLPVLAHLQMPADPTATIRPRRDTRTRSLSDLEPGVTPPEIELMSPRS